MLYTVSKTQGEIVLGSYRRTVLREDIEYVLVAKQTEERMRFHIVIRHENEKADEDFGEDVLRVVAFFSEIVAGGVFPYTLEELAEDYRQSQEKYGEKSRQRPLQTESFLL